ncbi:MAG: hypothetical protein GY759_17065 [Chloroflexi bacterium]|nr:hypothetical protein [Chloroflexota bacterium]
MSEIEQTITVKLPQSIVRRLQRAAEITYRSVDEVLASTVEAALSAPSDLPDELADELAAMHLLNDEALHAAAQPSLSAADQQRLQQLNQEAGEGELTLAEATEQTALLAAYYRSMLRRAQALAVLAQRGYPVLDQQACPE